MQTKPAKRSGEILRDLRADRGWTVEDLADEIVKEFGYRYAPSPRTIWRAEAGQRLSLRHEFGLARIFGKVPSDIWPTRPPRARRRSHRRVAA